MEHIEYIFSVEMWHPTLLSAKASTYVNFSNHLIKNGKSIFIKL